MTRDIKFIVLRTIFSVIQKFVSFNGYICVDNLYEKHTSCIDTYTIFQYLQSKHKRSKYIIWKDNLSFSKIIKNKKNLIVLNRPSYPEQSSYYFLRKTFFSLLTCKYFISSFYGSLPTEYRNFIKNNKKIKLIGVGHGPVLLKTLVFKYPFCQEQEWDLYLVSSENERKLFIEHGWPENKLLKCSLPRFDCCKNIKHKNKKIFIMFTWRLSFEKNPQYILQSKYLYNIFSLLTNEAFMEYLEKNNVEIVLGLHHALLDICGINIKFPCKIADTNNLINEINSSDLFITDYSSIFWDSAYLKHPLIFYRLDNRDKYLCETDKLDIANAEEQNKKLYNICYTEEEVIEKIKHYVANSFKLENKYIKLMSEYFYTTKSNTKTFLDILEKYNEN